MNELDWDAIWRPGLSVSVVLLPIGIAQQVLIDDRVIPRGGSTAALFFFGYLFLGAVAGFGAARLAPARPLPHGAAAAALAYAVVQGIGIIRHLVVGRSLVSPVSFAYLALLMATCGMLGAMLGRRINRLPHRET